MAMPGSVDKRQARAAERHVYGPRSLAVLVPLLSRPAYRRRSPAVAHLMADWEAIVGARIAAVSTPRKLFAGTLSIAARSPAAVELQHLSDVLIERINAHLGRVAVSRLRFVQDFAALPAEDRAAGQTASPRAVERARAAVAGLPESALRLSLERLGVAVLSRNVRRP